MSAAFSMADKNGSPVGYFSLNLTTVNTSGMSREDVTWEEYKINC